MTFKSLLAVAAAFALSLLPFASVVQAGAEGGPKAQVECVQAYDTDVYVVAFEHCEWARVVVKGDGDTDLDLYVYDAYGNVVAFDDDLTDACVVSWYAGERCKYTVRVVNRGCVYNEYAIATN